MHTYLCFFSSSSYQMLPFTKTLKMYGHHTNESKICNISLFPYHFSLNTFCERFFSTLLNFHCFSFRWLPLCYHVQWPDIKFDGIFHRINAEILSNTRHTHKIYGYDERVCFFFCFSQIFHFFPFSVKMLQKIMINANLDLLEISKRNY